VRKTKACVRSVSVCTSARVYWLLCVLVPVPVIHQNAETKTTERQCRRFYRQRFNNFCQIFVTVSHRQSIILSAISSSALKNVMTCVLVIICIESMQWLKCDLMNPMNINFSRNMLLDVNEHLKNDVNIMIKWRLWSALLYSVQVSNRQQLNISNVLYWMQC
jgi:hypothetical protein